jgi:hypothetical protein
MISGIIEPGGQVEMVRDPDGKMHARVPPSIFQQIAASETGRLILPVTGPEPESYIFSRFLAKIALEAMAQKLLKAPELLVNLIDDLQLDPIRDYARRGNTKTLWPYHKRRIYDENHKHTAEDGTTFQMLYEYNIFATKRNELYFALILLGVEYVINIGGPDIDGYEEWLQENQDRSPLY